MTRSEAYRYGMEKLTLVSESDARTDCLLLLEHAASLSMNDIFVHGEILLTDREMLVFKDSLDKRVDHIPVQYITGRQMFMGLEFEVNEAVLIPRADTEILVEEIMRLGLDNMNILDLCTGSGCIIISLIRLSHECLGTGTDISEEALEVAGRNAKAQGVDVRFLRGDLYEALADMPKDGSGYDIIVSNPPYIASAVVDTLMPEVRDHEPRLALDGDEDGLVFYRRIIADSDKHLNKGGWLFFEIGYDQGEAVRDLMEQKGYEDVEVVRDYSGNDRVVKGRMPLR
ncbi:MAG: peptide chain release factor N(5)-glutamine methyltransferase [Lachnospiraceae bacterium]|nr:peptide chain release factor N(5)-glutamine methyltransferase [Lachnospiraceae bacterium]